MIRVKNIVTIIVCAFFVMGCNKKDLEELQSDNDQQQTSIDNIEEILGINDAIHITAQGNTQTDSIAFNLSSTHVFAVDGDLLDSYLKDNGNGTYDIRIERSELASGNGDISQIVITGYDPTLGISSANVYAYLEIIETQTLSDGSNASISLSMDGSTDQSIVVINSFSLNTSTGAMSIDLTMNFEEGGPSYNTTQNPGTVNIIFSGDLVSSVALPKTSK